MMIIIQKLYILDIVEYALEIYNVSGKKYFYNNKVQNILISLVSSIK